MKRFPDHIIAVWRLIKMWVSHYLLSSVSSAEFYAMKALQGEQALSSEGIIKKGRLDHSTIATLLSNLEKKGWITITTPHQESLKAFSLTIAGRAKLEEVLRNSSKNLCFF